MDSGSAPGELSENAPSNEAGQPDDAAPENPGSADPSAKHSLAADWRRFSERLATFGLGEAQTPLLTDAVWSFDAEGNPR
jgi:hypothetical protein